MVKLVKAYSDRDEIVFELKVTAVSARGAESRARASFFLRNPGQRTALRKTDVVEMGRGVLKEYRVIFHLDPDENLRNILELDDAMEMLERLL